MSAPNRRETNDVGDSESDNEDSKSQPTDTDDEERESEPPSTNGEIFTDNANHPINFFIHESVKKTDTIRKLKADITDHGGRVVQDLEHALVVLVHRNYPSRKELQSSYEATQYADLRRIFVKQTSFIMNCIERNHMYLYEEEIKPMRGFPPGGRRNEFTSEDDENLCYYLSRITPDKEAGGRSGYNIYKQLVRLGEVNSEHFGWATRHTYQSWRGRYKNNKARMGELIERMVEEDPPTHKQLWREDRRLNKQRRSRHVAVSEEEMESTPEEGEKEGEEADNDEAIGQLKPVGVDNVPKPQQGKRVQSLHSPKHPRRPSKRPRTLNSESAKDKERAIEEEDEENVDLALNEVDFFDGQDFNGPEPSGRTLVATQTQQPPPASNFLTQRTLVPSTPRNGELQNHGLPAPTAWPSPIQMPLEVQATPVNTSTRSAPALLADSRSNRAQKQANEPGPTLPLPHDQGKPISLPTQPTDTAYQRPRMAARRPKGFLRPPAVDNSEPSHNTRSRAQQLPDGPPTQSKKKRKEEKIDDSEAERQSLIASPAVERVRETSGNNIERRQITQDDYGERDEPEASTRMDSDDAETKRNLSGPSKASLSLDIDASEILQRIQSVRVEGSSRHSARVDSLLVSATPRHSLQTPNRALITPVPRQWTGGSNSSSIESFPLSGTKASAMKKQLQQQEKNTPYKPPEGTRAARFAQQPRR